MFQYDTAFVLFLFSELVRSLANLAQRRFPDALAASTQRSYTAMFKIYLAFLAFIAVHPSQVNVDVTLAFLEFLNFNSIRVAQMQNYISAIKHFALRFALPIEALEHNNVAAYIKAIKKTAVANVIIHNVIDPHFYMKLYKNADLPTWARCLKPCT